MSKKIKKKKNKIIKAKADKLKSSRSKKTKKNKNKKKNVNKFYPPLVLSEKDQSKIKTKAIGGCKRAVTALRKAEADLKVFNEEDLPKFQEWSKQALNKEIEELNKEKEKFHKFRELYTKIHREVHFNFLSWEDAYLKVTAKDYVFIENEDYEKDQGCNFNFSDDGFTDEDSEEESIEAFMREMFEEIYEQFFDKKVDFEEAFQEFKNSADEEIGFKKGKITEDDEIKNDLRITELYRRLVKVLHPDLRSETNNSSQKDFLDELWHISQKSYLEKDYEGLKEVFALTLLYSNKEAKSIPLSDLSNAKLRMQVKTKSVRKELRRHKKNSAFGFSRKSESEKNKILKSVKKELANSCNAVKWEMLEIEYFLENLERKAKGIKKEVRKKEAKIEQTELPF